MLQIVSRKEYEDMQSTLEVLQHEIEKLKNHPWKLAYVSRAQAAEMLRKHEHTISLMAKRGDLRYRKEGRRIDIEFKSIVEYQEKYQVGRS